MIATLLVCAITRATTDGKYPGSKDGAAIYVAGKLDRFLDTPKDVRELCKDVPSHRSPSWKS